MPSSEELVYRNKEPGHNSRTPFFPAGSHSPPSPGTPRYFSAFPLPQITNISFSLFGRSIAKIRRWSNCNLFLLNIQVELEIQAEESIPACFEHTETPDIIKLSPGRRTEGRHGITTEEGEDSDRKQDHAADPARKRGNRNETDHR